MGKEIFNIVNDMSEVLNASQLQKLQEVLVNPKSDQRWIWDCFLLFVYNLNK